MATSKKAAAKGRQGKQDELPGVDVDSRKIPEIEEAYENYEKVMKRRVKLTEQETEAMDAVVATMEKHKRSVYRRIPWGTLTIPEPTQPRKKVKFTPYEEQKEQPDLGESE